MFNSSCLFAQETLKQAEEGTRFCLVYNLSHRPLKTPTAPFKQAALSGITHLIVAYISQLHTYEINTLLSLLVINLCHLWSFL